MRFGGLILLIGLFTALPVAGQTPFEYVEQYPYLPVTADFVPDSNFTFQSYCLPNNPRCELIHDDHLYLGAGVFLQIYNLGNDGLPILTCQIQTHDLIWDLEYDGEYLYVANGYRGLTIYDGNDYSHPAELSNLLTDQSSGMYKICISGDSLFYQTGSRLGIINVGDRNNPYVERLIEEDSINIMQTSYNDIRIYQNYLISYVLRHYDQSGAYYIGIFNISSQSGIPEMVDSIRITSGFSGLHLFGNRLYILSPNSFDIYEFEDPPRPSLKYSLILDNYHKPYGFFETMIDNSRVGFLSIVGPGQNPDSGISKIYAFSLDDLNNPSIIDSTDALENVVFNGVWQNNFYTYGIGHHGWYDWGFEPGLFIIEWDSGFNSQLVGHYSQYSFCNAVEARGDIAYVSTLQEGIIVLDISDKTDPQVVGQINGIAVPVQMKMDGERLYTISATTFKIYDISNPVSPLELGHFNLPYGYFARNFEIHDNIVFICFYVQLPNGYGGMLNLDISDLSNIEILFDNSALVRGPSPMELEYPMLYMLGAGAGDWQIRLYDVSSPTTPLHIHDIDDLLYNPSSAAARNDYLYVFGGYNEIYDVSNPWNPLMIWRDVHGRGYKSLVDGDYLYLWRTAAEDYGVYVWNIESNPEEMQDAGFYHCYAYGNISVDPPYIYVAAQEWGMITLRFDVLTDVPESDVSSPEEIGMLTGYPNPFNSTIKFNIKFVSPSGGGLYIYDVTGRLVKSIALGLPSAIYWDGTDNRGNDVASGVYFVRLEDKQISKTVKVVLLR